MKHQLTPFLDPLSSALIPMVNGITRHLLLRTGVAEEERTLLGIPVHFYRLDGAPGSDPELPIILIHGIADSALTWAFVLHGLAKIGPVYVIDLPGFGLSGYPQGRRYARINEHVGVVRALIAQVIGRPALLIGNSLGGWIAARLAIESPASICGMVVIDPGGARLAGRPSWEPFIQTVAVPDLRAVRRVFRQMFGLTPLLLALYLTLSPPPARTTFSALRIWPVSAYPRASSGARLTAFFPLAPLSFSATICPRQPCSPWSAAATCPSVNAPARW